MLWKFYKNQNKRKLQQKEKKKHALSRKLEIRESIYEEQQNFYHLHLQCLWSNYTKPYIKSYIKRIKKWFKIFLIEKLNIQLLSLNA